MFHKFVFSLRIVLVDSTTLSGDSLAVVSLRSTFDYGYRWLVFESLPLAPVPSGDSTMDAGGSLCRGLLVLLFSGAAFALRYDPQELLYNLNTNETATDPLDYWGAWENHTFNPSPSNWRMPMYTLMLDRFANGDPTNDDANGTQYEHDLTQTQLRHGGDISGLQDSLDYLQGMGIKVSGSRGFYGSSTSADT